MQNTYVTANVINVIVYGDEHDHELIRLKPKQAFVGQPSGCVELISCLRFFAGYSLIRYAVTMLSTCTKAH